jgi:O-antigen ligase
MTDQRTVESSARPVRGSSAVSILIGVAAAAVVIVAVLFLEPVIVGGVLLVVCGLFVFRREVFTRTTMLFVLIAVILFIPIRRYALPIPIGFALEPYRVLIAGLLVWLALTVILRGRANWKPVVWGWPIAIFLWTAFFSLMANSVALTQSGFITGGFSNVFQLAFLLSTVILVRQLLSTEKVTMVLLNVIVFSGAIIGVLAFFERVTRRNVFLMLGNFLPLQILRDDAESLRAGGNRAYASSQHPIALAVLFCMIIPIAIYLIKFSVWPAYQFTRTLVYVAAIGAMMVGMLAAVSRTGVVTLGVMFLFVLLLRPKLAGVLAAIGLPIAVLLGLIFPQLVQTMVLSLFDIDGVIASQTTSVGLAGQGRLADLPEAFAQFAAAPFAGSGIASRIVVGEGANSQILDNQWLGSLIDTGVVGMVGMFALFVWPIVKLVRFAMRPGVPPQRGFLAFAIATSTVAYTVSMFFHDSFAFMQTLIVLAILYAIAAWAMTEKTADGWTPDAPAFAERRVAARSAS